MFNRAKNCLFLFTLLGCPAIVEASPFTISTSGIFSSTTTTTPLSAPSGDWSFNLAFDDLAVAQNAAADGFDLSFTNFAYRLNGASVSQIPQSIRVYQAANSGLLTLFFGPQSGSDSEGNFVPVLTLAGPQLFSGSTSLPVINPGNYQIAEFTFTDSMNFDNQLAPGFIVSIAAGSAVPEPATAWYAISAMLAVGLGLGRRKLLQR